ncbi:hypothetical protein V8E52_008902, partial [Russula decolorans]
MPQEQLANSNDLHVERFRILVVGNANAGKTTILKKVCHAKGREPVYLNVSEMCNPLAASPARLLRSFRGEHNIEHQFQYPTAHGFVFHDSRGFEAGGADELKKVKDFIENRAKSEQLKDQLHVIWYCLPTSNDRGMTEAEMSLFESGTGNVPVIAIFTKMDALDDEARNQLMWDDDVLPAKIKEEVPIRAKAIFKKNYLERLEEVKHRPREVVQLRGMDKEGTNCNKLIVRTSRALNGDTLRLFCLSILRNDIESRIKQVINQRSNERMPLFLAALGSRAFPEEQTKSLFCEVMRCFPHMLVRICS